MLLQIGRAVPTTPWELVLTSSPETKFVLAILVGFSVISWYLIVLKWWQFRRMRQLADRFMAEIERAPRLEDAYHVAMRLPSSPYNRLLREGVNFFSELKPGTLKKETAVATEKLIGAKSFEKAIEVQSDYAKTSYESFVAEASKLGELYADLAREAYKPFEAQFGKAASAK